MDYTRIDGGETRALTDRTELYPFRPVRPSFHRFPVEFARVCTPYKYLNPAGANASGAPSLGSLYRFPSGALIPPSGAPSPIS